MTEPTESSMPPVMMTKASAIEKMPKSPIRLAGVGQVDRREEARIDERDGGADDDDEDEKAEILLEHRRPFLVRPVADGELQHVASLKSERARKPLISPSCMTAMRSLTPITSSMSLEIIMMATPLSASSRMSS